MEESMKRVLTITGLLLLATMSGSAQSAPAAEKPGQLLAPELEMAVIRQLNLGDRIATRQAVLPKRAEGQDGGADVSGEWVCFTTMFLNGPTGKGIMYLDLKQDGDVISGESAQLKHPFDPPSTIRTIPERTLKGNIKGKWYKGYRTHMMVLERQRGTKTWAIFTAVIAGDGRTATGQLVNNGGNYGTMHMVRWEALADYQHLLTDKGRQAAEAQSLKGVEQLEASLSEKALQSTQTFWWKSDKNQDGYISYAEFPHPDWHRANLNGDEFLSWREELTDRALKPLARQGKYQAKYAASPKKAWSSRHEWASDRPDFQWLFPFIDRDRDKKITADEYKAFEVQVKSYLDKSFPKTNERGETGIEVYKRMTGRSRKGLSQKAGRSRKTSWNSKEEWNRDKPTMEWIFPFIDKNSDGKIDSDEYQAIQEYKKKHADWQNRARMELGIEFQDK
jgi:Ca2+-binding EF-hand superfamily protein